MDVAGLVLFASVYFVAVASPGPGLAAVVARGLGQGLTAAPAFVAGFVVGDLIWFTVASTGLAVIAREFAPLFVVIKYAGCAYLLWLAWRIWSQPVATTTVEADGRHHRAWPSFLGSLSLTLGNPKVMVFFLSIMPLVVDVGDMSVLAFVEMAAVIVLVIAPVMTAALLLAHRARRIFTSRQALTGVNRATALVMGGVAAVIATRG